MPRAKRQQRFFVLFLLFGFLPLIRYNNKFSRRSTLHGEISTYITQRVTNFVRTTILVRDIWDG